ncbi:MAG: TetR/AcrR family transcriptional regulator [Candidatus Lokiarchaeota archaeon]|nr:TetR/AcrR family transcriptional regulator [Candidatus Lokiarchaeota archaeon]
MDQNSSNKQTRSRSPEKKAAQFERILEAGKELFLEKGKDGFSLRGLAKILGMNQNNLYNYVESKRELWIALRNKFYKQYREENIKIIKNHKGSTINLLMKIFIHFLEFADNDFGAFSMMHLTESPPSDKIGPFEKEYREFNYLRGTTRVIKVAIEEGEIKDSNAEMLSFFTYSLILGAALVERHMRKIEQNQKYKGDLASEIVQFGRADFTRIDFRNFILEKLEQMLID